MHDSIDYSFIRRCQLSDSQTQDDDAKSLSPLNLETPSDIIEKGEGSPQKEWAQEKQRPGDHGEI